MAKASGGTRIKRPSSSRSTDIGSITAEEWTRRKVSANDYFVLTSANFENVAKYEGVTNREKIGSVIRQWQEMKSSGKYEFHKSPLSNSQYLIDKTSREIYRYSNHWGAVASCLWKLDGADGNRQIRINGVLTEMPAIGRCKIKDFNRDNLRSWQIESYKRNHQQNKK